ncbi:nitroreductase family deazaflavin-dependent oxidoreductase [Nocardia uniformis]|uniref:Nitroreductase family deazaflavin-dependent oxidoreductase n=1 Tax=Nocardia uniformis TaxID=53432 RepID=A0A849BVJ6_9NOCA|nr:nitroreductase/quinone reductase family protein [Nocardia uniformis]NNH69118.1 nitroreductase family deazaflavin-dependent oxidoreductase [Nocardia uniformis]
MSSPSENPYGTPSTDGPEPIRGYQNVVNTIVRGLLKVPGLSKGVGKRLLTLHVVGRKSGQVYDVPVAYTRHNGDLLIGTGMRPWVKNLRGKVPVKVSMGGAAKEMLADVLEDEKSVMVCYEVIAADNKANAKFNGIGFHSDGTPNKADIYQTWQQGGVIVRLTPLA